MITSTTTTLRRIRRRTLTEQRTRLTCVAIVCTRCHQSAPPQHVERDPRTGD